MTVPDESTVPPAPDEGPERGLVLDVSVWAAAQGEDLGARDKMWLATPTFDDEPEGLLDPQWLWKEGRATGLPAPGADLWAEVISGVVATTLLIPAAKVRLASRELIRGVLVQRISGTLTHGNELLAEIHRGYDSGKRGPVEGYDLNSIGRVLSDFEGYEPGQTANDSFAGLLVLDALTANTDRHHENWAVVDGRLSPTYDHGASLGFNVNRSRYGQIEIVAAGGKSRHFPGRPTLVNLANDGLSRCSRQIREMWLDRVAELRLEQVARSMGTIPYDWMSDPARTFVIELIMENRRRLLA